MGEFDALEPEDYDEKGSMKSERSVLVFDADRRSGIVELSYSWDDLDYQLTLSEQYSDSSHLDALDFMAERYDDEDLPDDIDVEDIESVSAASSAGMNIKWKDEITFGRPGSDLNY